MPELPEQVRKPDVDAAIERFGFPLVDLIELRITPRGIEAVYKRTNSDRAAYTFGDEIATQTTRIGYARTVVTHA